ncbi:hypothetical protein OIU79_007686 [Salix purpurea]|uniref:Uncharacterized protein n=1 Tax=Salix purpurea TaxID=77065 RepID=A0A9Q0TGL4_SALPP|nr:hypothetical protein OIU79_007686 [Salix purpurea]
MGRERYCSLLPCLCAWTYPPYLFHDLWVYWSYPLRSISQDFDRIRRCSIKWYFYGDSWYRCMIPIQDDCSSFLGSCWTDDRL